MPDLKAAGISIRQNPITQGVKNSGISNRIRLNHDSNQKSQFWVHYGLTKRVGGFRGAGRDGRSRTHPWFQADDQANVAQLLPQHNGGKQGVLQHLCLALSILRWDFERRLYPGLAASLPQTALVEADISQ